MVLTLIGFILWIIYPALKDLLGFNYKKNLNVYESYVSLELMRKYKREIMYEEG